MSGRSFAPRPRLGSRQRFPCREPLTYGTPKSSVARWARTSIIPASLVPGTSSTRSAPSTPSRSGRRMPAASRSSGPEPPPVSRSSSGMKARALVEFATRADRLVALPIAAAVGITQRRRRDWNSPLRASSVNRSTPSALAQVYAFFFGACFGSFLNVCIVRWPRERSILRPRSRCPHCGNQLPWFENIPILSWIVLRGRCRCCDEPISRCTRSSSSSLRRLGAGRAALWRNAHRASRRRLRHRSCSASR